MYCVKSVQIRSFFWPVFFHIWTEYGEILCISPYSVRMRENTDQKKLRIWTLFMQWRFNLFKTNNRNTKNDTTKCKMCLKLTVRIPERPQ